MNAYTHVRSFQHGRHDRVAAAVDRALAWHEDLGALDRSSVIVSIVEWVELKRPGKGTGRSARFQVRRSGLEKLQGLMDEYRYWSMFLASKENPESAFLSGMQFHPLPDTGPALTIKHPRFTPGGLCHDDTLLLDLGRLLDAGYGYVRVMLNGYTMAADAAQTSHERRAGMKLDFARRTHLPGLFFDNLLGPEHRRRLSPKAVDLAEGLVRREGETVAGTMITTVGLTGELRELSADDEALLSRVLGPLLPTAQEARHLHALATARERWPHEAPPPNPKQRKRSAAARQRE